MTDPARGAAVVLPGENGVLAGMLEPWLRDAPAREVVDEVSAVIGRDVVDWWHGALPVQDPVVACLEVVVTGIAGTRSLLARGLTPVAMAGHGVGEYAALVAAGALELGQVVEFLHWQTELLVLAPRPSYAGLAEVRGAGAAAAARAAVVAVGGSLAIAAFDSPDSVVLAGTCDELAAADEVVDAAGLSAVRLPGRAPCHSPLVAPVASHLVAALAGLDWSVPRVPVVPNADAVPTRDPDRLAARLREHLTSPVRWEDTARALAPAGVTSVVEVGAVPVLGPLIRRVQPDLPVSLVAGPGTPVPTVTPGLALAGPGPSRGET